MCGFAGEHRPGERADVAAVEAMAAAMAPRGPDGAGSWSAGPVALAHRRLKIIDLSEQGSQPLVDPHVGRTVVFNGCIYNHRELRAELRARGPPLLLDERHRGDREGARDLGRPLRRPVHGDVRLRHRRARQRPARCSPATVSASSRCTSRTSAGRCASAPRCPGCSRAAASTRRSTRSRCTTTSPGTASCRRPARSCRASASCRPRRCSWSSPTGGAGRSGTGRRRTAGCRSTSAGTSTTGRTRCWMRCAPRSTGAWSPTSPWASCSPAAWTRASSSRCSPRPASTGWRRSRSASSPAAAARATSSATPTSSRGSSGPTTTSSRSRPRAWSRRCDGAIAAMSEPMMSHDGVAFYLLSEQVSQLVQGRAVRAGRRRGARRLLLVPDGGRAPRRRLGRRRVRRGVLRPHPRRARRDARGRPPARAGRQPGVRRGALRARAARRAGRPRAAPRHRGDARRRPGQARRQHDHGLGPRGARAVPRPRVRRARGARARRR